MGTFDNANGEHGYLRDAAGTYTQIDVPGALFTNAFGINDAGQIVGRFYDTSGVGHGFLRTPAKLNPALCVPKWFQAGIPGGNPGTYPNNFWGPFLLDNDQKDHYTIAKGGCALTAFTTLLNFWKNNLTSPSGYPCPTCPFPGIPPLDPRSSTNKMWPNNWTGKLGLFSLQNNGQLQWNNFASYPQAKLARVYLCSPTNCGQYPSFPVLPNAGPPDATQTLVNILRNKVPVILPLLNSSIANCLENRTCAEVHWVVVTGWDSQASSILASFLVNDPGDVKTKTLNDVPNAGYARGDHITTATVMNSLNHINGWKVYTDHPLVVQDPITPQALGIYTDAPVEFVLTDPQGRRTGFNLVTNTSFQDIPASAYSTSQYCDELNFSGCKSPFKALDMANQMPGQYTLDVSGTGSGAFTVEVRASDVAGNWITQTYSGTTAPGTSSQFTFQGAVTIFAAFSANVAINNSKNEFAVGGQFTLGAGSPGINPLTQPVTLQVDAFSITIPAGSFQLDSHGNYVFLGTINGVQLAAGIQPQGGNQYAYGFAGQNATTLPTTNPVDVGLAIGSDGGSTSVNANFAP